MAKHPKYSHTKARNGTRVSRSRGTQERQASVLREDSLPYRVNGNGIRRPFNVLDTFAGAGGFSLGFQLAGCRIIGGIEIDSWASQTFAHNHKDALVITRDIQMISDDELRESRAGRHPDILLGGPPCQGFSICRKNSGDPTDPRNSLFHRTSCAWPRRCSRITSLWRMFRTLRMRAHTLASLSSGSLSAN